MRVFVKPAAGLNVRHPEKLHYILPAEGEEVEMSTAWKRLINFGDVTVVAAPVVKSKGDKE